MSSKTNPFTQQGSPLGLSMGRRDFLRRSAAVAAGIAGANYLAACGGGGNGAGNGSGSFTMWTLSDTTPVMRYFAEKYKKVNPKFDLKVTEVPAGLSYRAKILSAAAAGDLPDLIDTKMQYGPDFATYSMFEPLGEGLANAVDDYSLSDRIWPWFNTASIPGYEGEDHIYGMPYAMSVFVPAYRADLFRKARLDFPTNWDELVNVGQALTNAPDRYALSVPTSGDLMDEFHPFLMQAGTSYVNDDLSEAFPEREAAYAAFSFYRDLSAKYGIAPKQTPDRYSSDPVQRLASGQVAITTLATLSIDAFRDKVKDLKFGEDADWYIGRFWEGPGGPGGYFNASGVFIRRGVKDRSTLTDYFKWLVEPEQQIDVYKKFNLPPVNTSVWSEFSDDPAWPIYEDSIAISERQGGFKGWKLAEFVIDRGVERVVVGGEPVEQVVDQTAVDMLQALHNA